MERPFDYPGSQPSYKRHTFNLPGRWAAALINGDWADYDEEEATAIRSFLAEEGRDLELIAQDDDIQHGFFWHHDAAHVWPFGSFCEEFTFIYRN